MIGDIESSVFCVVHKDSSSIELELEGSSKLTPKCQAILTENSRKTSQLTHF